MQIYCDQLCFRKSFIHTLTLTLKGNLLFVLFGNAHSSVTLITSFSASAAPLYLPLRLTSSVINDYLSVSREACQKCIHVMGK